MILVSFLSFTGLTVTSMFYFFRTQKKLPTNWTEFKFELKNIWCGLKSTIEDNSSRKRNKTALYDQGHKIVVLTGGNRGIGIHVLKSLLMCKMTVCLGVRSPVDAKTAIEKFIDPKITQGKLYYEKCDTGDLGSIRTFANKIQIKFQEIHLLINNAAILGVPYKETKDGFESQMGVNYLGHFLLTHLLMPQLKAGALNNDGKNVRIVNVSSCCNNVGIVDYEDFQSKKCFYSGQSYANSKLVQLMSTKHLDTILRDEKLRIQTVAPHPGIVDTDLFLTSSSDYIPFIKKILYKTPAQGAETIMYAAISPNIEGKGGNYLSNCESSKDVNNIVNDPAECKKVFEFTCKLLQIDAFGKAPFI